MSDLRKTVIFTSAVHDSMSNTASIMQQRTASFLQIFPRLLLRANCPDLSCHVIDKKRVSRKSCDYPAVNKSRDSGPGHVNAGSLLNRHSSDSPVAYLCNKKYGRVSSLQTRTILFYFSESNSVVHYQTISASHKNIPSKS